MTEAMISISRPDGSMTPPVPMSVAKKALEQIESRKLSSSNSADNRQIEAFTPEETGEKEVVAVARDQLRSFIERIERLEDEKKTIADDIKDVYGEAKGTGFDTKILKKVIAIRKQDKDERLEQEAILDTYLAALGMLEAGEDD
jgi:uncharacterized protein (UPF0335 family)